MEDSVQHRYMSRPSSTPQSSSQRWSPARKSVNDIAMNQPLQKLLGKPLRYIYLVFVLWLLGRLLSLTGFCLSDQQLSQTQGEEVLLDYFSSFEGYTECDIRAVELYSPSPRDDRGFYKHGTFCHDRRHLLKALSEGGRVGFDAPYQPRGCNYRWFHPNEICNILIRFDGLVFIGDDSLLPIYGGLNILLRQDLALGALDLESMTPDLQRECRCNNQYVKSDCRNHFLQSSSSDKISIANGNRNTHQNPPICNHPPHALLHLTSPTLDEPTLTKFHTLVPKAPRSSYRPIPIITSLSPSTHTTSQASTLLLSTLHHADATQRNTPILWLGPTAAGHIEIRGRKGNQEIWDFDRKMAQVAVENDIEVLGMWNLTVQAGSWDGVRFGERVAVVQAMMVLNWLSRLESS